MGYFKVRSVIRMFEVTDSLYDESIIMTVIDVYLLLNIYSWQPGLNDLTCLPMFEVIRLINESGGNSIVTSAIVYQWLYWWATTVVTEETSTVAIVKELLKVTVLAISEGNVFLYHFSRHFDFIIHWHSFLRYSRYSKNDDIKIETKICFLHRHKIIAP